GPAATPSRARRPSTTPATTDLAGLRPGIDRLGSTHDGMQGSGWTGRSNVGIDSKELLAMAKRTAEINWEAVKRRRSISEAAKAAAAAAAAAATPTATTGHLTAAVDTGHKTQPFHGHTTRRASPPTLVDTHTNVAACTVMPLERMSHITSIAAEKTTTTAAAVAASSTSSHDPRQRGTGKMVQVDPAVITANDTSPRSASGTRSSSSSSSSSSGRGSSSAGKDRAASKDPVDMITPPGTGLKTARVINVAGKRRLGTTTTATTGAATAATTTA
ncbi:unnamed protein product, partial [Sphacelaria rigidula]